MHRDASGFRRMVFGRWADWQSSTRQTASLRYCGSAKMCRSGGEPASTANPVTILVNCKTFPPSGKKLSHGPAFFPRQAAHLALTPRLLPLAQDLRKGKATNVSMPAK